MLVELPLYLDLLPGAPKASDLHDALAAHTPQSNTLSSGEGAAPTEDGNWPPTRWR